VLTTALLLLTLSAVPAGYVAAKLHTTLCNGVGLYTILPEPILYGIYCNKGGSGRDNILRNSEGDKGGKWGAQPKGVFAQNIVDSFTKALYSTNIL